LNIPRESHNCSLDQDTHSFTEPGVNNQRHRSSFHSIFFSSSHSCNLLLWHNLILSYVSQAVKSKLGHECFSFFLSFFLPSFLFFLRLLLSSSSSYPSLCIHCHDTKYRIQVVLLFVIHNLNNHETSISFFSLFLQTFSLFSAFHFFLFLFGYECSCNLPQYIVQTVTPPLEMQEEFYRITYYCYLKWVYSVVHEKLFHSMQYRIDWV